MSKGPRPIVRFVIYPIIVAIFLAACYCIALLASGYRLEYKNGKIFKTPTGMVIVATKPGDAKVYIDGKQHKKNTPLFSFLDLTAKNISVGEHVFKIEKEGYETWEEKISVEPKLISKANYIILVPQKREASKYNLPGSLTATVSNDSKSRMVAIAEDKTAGYRTFWDINLQTKEKTKVREEKIVPEEKVSLVYLNDDSTRMLVARTLTDQKSFIVYEVKPEGLSWNITSLYQLGFESLRFSPSDRGTIYAIKSGNLYVLNYEQKRMSAVIANNVTGLYPNNSDMYVIKKTEENIGLWRINSGQGLDVVVEVLPASDAYQFRHIKTPDGYLILSQKDKELILFQKDRFGNPTSKSIARDVNYFVMSPKDTRVLLVGDNGVRTYSFEKEEYYDVTNQKVESISWFNDSENIVYSLGGKINLITFKGEYNKFLFDNLKGTSVYSLSSSSNIYFIQSAQEISDLFVFSFNF